MIQSLSPKDPDSVEFFNWDFTAVLIAGDSIASVVSTVVTSGDSALVLEGSPALSGSLVSQRISGGTLGTEYTVRCRITTTLGETLDLSFSIFVENQ